MIFRAEEQALRPNWIKNNIDDQEVSGKCRIYEERDDSITHLIAECENLAEKESKEKHDKITRIVHMELCQNFGLVGKVK